MTILSQEASDIGRHFCFQRNSYYKGSLSMLFLIKIIGILSICLWTQMSTKHHRFIFERGKTFFILFFPIDDIVSFHKPFKFLEKNATNTRGFPRKWEDFSLFPINDTISVNIPRKNALIKFLCLRGMICSVLLKLNTKFSLDKQ